MTPFLGLINLLERLTELTLNVHQIIKGHNTDEQPDEVICKLRSGRVLSAGASVPVELGESPSLCECLHQPGSSLNPLLLVFCGRFLTCVCVCVCMCVCVWSVAHSCPALCNPMDCSLPGSSVHGIFQTRILEWVAISSRGSSLPRGQTVSPPLTSRFFTTEPPGKPHSSSRHEYEQVITPLPASLPSMKDGR